MATPNYTPPTLKSRIAFALGYLSEQLYYATLNLNGVIYRSALKLDLRAAAEGVARADGGGDEGEGWDEGEDDEEGEGEGEERCPYCGEEDEDVQE
jgi:hypothetical protein